MYNDNITRMPAQQQTANREPQHHITSRERIHQPNRASHRHAHRRHATIRDVDAHIATATTAATASAAALLLALLAALAGKAVADAGAAQADAALLHRFAQFRQSGFDRLPHLLMLRNKKGMCMVIGNLEHDL